MRINFGTYAGWEIENVPTEYLKDRAIRWANAMNREAAERELARRDAETTAKLND